MTLDIASILWVGLVIGVFAVFAGWPKAGALAYLAAVLFAPVMRFGGFSLRVEMVLTPLMLGWLVLNGAFRWRVQALPFFGWLVGIAAVSYCTEGDVDLIGLYGLTRFVAVALVFGSIPWRGEDILRAQFLFAASAIPIALLSIGQFIGIGWLRELTGVAYSYASQSVMERQMEYETQGYIFRGIGVFGNVSPAATYFLVAAGIAVLLLCDAAKSKTLAHRVFLLICLGAAMAGGAATFSATFIGGMVPLVAIATLLLPRGGRAATLRLVGLVGFLCFGAATFAMARSEDVAVQFEYQWNRLVRGEVLDQRYSGQEYVLAEALEGIRQHPFLGHGCKIDDTFYGDSLYVSLAYTGGLGALLLFFGGIIAVSAGAFRRGLPGRLSLLWIVITLLCGIGSTGMLVLRFGDWWWAAQGMLVASPSRARTAVTPICNPSFSSRTATAPFNAPARRARAPASSAGSVA